MAWSRHPVRYLGWILIILLAILSFPTFANEPPALEQAITEENLCRAEFYESDADHASLFPGYSEDEKLLTALLDCYHQAMVAMPVQFQYPSDPNDTFELTVCLQMNPTVLFILDDGKRAQLTFAKESLLFTKPGDNNFLTITDQALAARLIEQINELVQAQRARTRGRLVMEPEQGIVPIGRSVTIKGDMEGNNDKMMVFLTPSGSLPDKWSGDFYASIKSTSTTNDDVIYPCQKAIFLGQAAVQYGRYEQKFTIAPQLGRCVDGSYGAITPGEWQLVVRGGKAGGVGIVSTATLNIVPGAEANYPALVADGKELVTEVPPELRDNCIFVPVRALAEALDCQVEYEEEQRRTL
ncbi:MAG TPA: stalk domain-containing protein, partial [bacterium]|nr:stalk domain-containing protein [bacterium]